MIDGLQADVVTLALSNDIDEIAKRGLIARNWQSRLPDNSAPYTSTIIFLVRKGNPWKIKDWGDLVKPGVDIVTPNPKTGGAPALGLSGRLGLGPEAARRQRRQGRRPTSATCTTTCRCSTPGRAARLTTFVQRGIGDVLLTWENEALLALKEFGADKFEIVYPSMSILAEPSVAVVDRNVDRRKTRTVAEGYLNFLYSPAGPGPGRQAQLPSAQRRGGRQVRQQVPEIPLVTIDEQFGGWAKAQARHFADGGVFDQIYKPGV